MASRSRVLIIGVDGFTGQHMANEFRDSGYEVFGSSLVKEEQSAERFHLDLLDKRSIQHVIATVKPSIVVHLAGIAFVAHDDPTSIYNINIVGTRNLLSALATAPCTINRLLIPSSAVVYGNSESNPNEDSPLNPPNDYGISKVAVELLAKNWSAELPITITRPFNYTGRGQNSLFVIPKIVNHFVSRDQSIALGDLTVEREFNDVRTVCKIYREICESDSTVDKTLNVCSGLTVSLNEVLAIMKEISSHAPTVNIDSNFIRSGEIRKLSGDNSRLVSLLGPQQFPSVTNTLEWMYAQS